MTRNYNQKLLFYYFSGFIKKVLIVFFIFLPLLSQTRDNVEIRSKLSPSIALVGDILTLEIDVLSPLEYQVEIDNNNQTLKDYVLIKISKQRSKVKGNKKISSKSFVFSCFKVGIHTIEPFVIRYSNNQEKKKIYTGSFLIKVGSLLNKNEHDIRPIKGPVCENKKKYFFIFVSTLLILLVLFFVLIKTKKRRADTRVEIKSFWEIALAEIELLTAKSFIEQNLYKKYFFQLTNILRNYIESSFHVMAPERTTEEFLDLIKNKKLFSFEHQSLLEDFLMEADLIKFAEKQVEKDQIYKATELVRSFIKQTGLEERINKYEF